MKSRLAQVRWLCSAILLACSCAPPAERFGPYHPIPPKKDYGRQLPPGQLALRKIDPKDYPDFSRGFAERGGLEEAIRHSLSYLAKPSSQHFFPYGPITHAQAVDSLKAFLNVLHEAQSPEQLDRLIRERFDVYQSVGWDNHGTVFFTGYYTPVFEGRRQREGPFRFPIYKMPPDLVKTDDGRILGRRTPDGQLVPYPTRREIEEQRQLEGTEIAWLKDPFEAYIITVQGSAKIRLADGSIYEVGYAAHNGHEYVPIARQMIADGAMDRDQLSLQAMREYFRQNPDKVNHYCWMNPRYVFFREAPGGPFGSINTPVTPYRTIATDKEIFPRACLAFLVSTLPVITADRTVQQQDYAGFALDQDTGGAIRAAGRTDVYMGVGQTAEALAGRTGAEGQLYYLFVKGSDGGSPPAATNSQNELTESRQQTIMNK